MRDDITDKLIDTILAENEVRTSDLLAEYDPVTGEGLERFLPEKRVRLSIPDFAIPVQYVPASMMKVSLVKGIVKAGSIDSYIETHQWKGERPDHIDIERRLRRIRHKYDFCFWAYFCIRIKAKRGGRIRFKLNYPQLIALALCEKLRAAGVPINIIILKARQWGGSTFCFFYQTWILCKWDHFHSFAIAAHIQTASETIFMMLKRAIEDYPPWDLGLPDNTVLKLTQMGKSGHAYVIKDEKNRQVLEGAIFLGTAEKPDTLRSKDIAGAHCSEVGVWPDTPEKRAEDLVADIQGGIIDAPLTMEVLESTAKNSTDFFHTVWVDSCSGKGGYERLFIPWFKIEHDRREIKEDMREFVRWLLEHKDDDRPAPGWRDSGKYYYCLWPLGATLEGINWYRYRRLRISFAKMCNEAPSTPEQAFVTAGRKVFDPFEVSRMRQECKAPMYVGDLISEAREGPGVVKNIRFIPNSEGSLMIWEKPDDSPIANRYVVAVDIGGDTDTSDYSSVRVLDRLLLMPDFGLSGKASVVAEMHYHCPHDQLAYDAARLAAWYNDALLVIESNTLETKDKERDTSGDGFEYILDIVSKFYKNLYMRHNKEEEVGDKIIGRYGFHTNVSTKPKIIDNMKAMVRDHLWYEPSVLCCDEMSIYIDDNGKFTAPPGQHDDVVMSTAILLWVGLREMELPQWIRPQPERRQSDEIRGGSNIVKL